VSKADFYLDQFTRLANKTSLHPLDWARFYRFIGIAHASRIGWSHADLHRRLVKAGLTNETATELAEAYWHARCALYVRNHMEYRENYPDWMRKDGARLT